MGINGIEFGTLVGWFLFSHNIDLSVSFITTIYNGVFFPKNKKIKNGWIGENRVFELNF